MPTKSKTTHSKKLARVKKVGEVKPLNYGTIQWTYTKQKPD